MTVKLNQNTLMKSDNTPYLDKGTSAKRLLMPAVTRTVTVTALMILAACSDAEQTSQANSASTHSNATAESSTASSEPAKTMTVALSTIPLDKPVFLGLVVPEVKAAAPCPFLSDEAAMAVVKKDWGLKRRDTSNVQCYWSKNLGFSIKITVEPLATAKPVAERAYNLDNPPVLKNQAAPGNNAVVLYDTAWDKEQAYALSFEQDSQLIMIYVTGMNTDADRLTAAAKEVAAQLSTAASMSSQTDNTGPFDMCSTWSQPEIETIIGTPMQIIPGSLDCKWETGNGDSLKQIRVTIYSGKSYPWESVLEQGASDIAGVGERGLMENKRKKGQMPGHVLMNALYNEMLVTVTVTDTIADHKALAVALAQNIDSRL